ncbi:MAG: chemotaxis protein CheW [Desulforhopalus sp.]|nr:chemotaxis protein CheW [Desulforhopalus sp.]
MSRKQIDWQEIRHQVEAIGVMIAKGHNPAPQEVDRILRQRAESLAREQVEPVTGDSLHVVEFLLANERYAIESHFVSEVNPMDDYTPLPGVPPFVLGLVNVRGRILSVIDLKKFFNMPPQGISDLNKIIIIDDGTMEFGILADAILGIQNLAVSSIAPPPPALTGIGREFLRGISGEHIIVLDAARIIGHKNIVVHEEV